MKQNERNLKATMKENDNKNPNFNEEDDKNEKGNKENKNKKNKVDEAGKDSFPASDPPNFTFAP